MKKKLTCSILIIFIILTNCSISFADKSVFDVEIEEGSLHHGYIVVLKPDVDINIFNNALNSHYFHQLGIDKSSMILKASSISVTKWCFAESDILSITPDYLMYNKELGCQDIDKNKWYYNSAFFSIDRGFMLMNNNNFRPSDKITRAQYITAIGRLYESLFVTEIKNDTSPFTDIDENKYYSKYINWAYENNIINGKKYNLFYPDSVITRQEVAVIIDNFTKSSGLILSFVRIPDINDMLNASHWARDSIWYISYRNIMNPYYGYFYPQQGLTRADTAKTLMNIYRESTI